MVEVNVVYEGDLHCTATHGPSGARLSTDAPTDNMGKGEAFSPTDLVGTALGTCMLTLIGITARRHELDVAGTTARVTKEMSKTPPRRIARLAVEIRFLRTFGEEDRRRLEAAALTCPVHKSLHPDVDAPVTFQYAGATP